MLPRNLGRKKTLAQAKQYKLRALSKLHHHCCLRLYQTVPLPSIQSHSNQSMQTQQTKLTLKITILPVLTCIHCTPQLTSLLRMLACKALSLPSYGTSFRTMQELSPWIFCPRVSHTAGQQHRALLGQCYTSVKQSGSCSKEFTL